MFSEEKTATVLLFQQHIVFFTDNYNILFCLQRRRLLQFYCWTTHYIFTDNYNILFCLLIIIIFYFVYRGEDSYSFTIWTTHCIFTNDHVPDSLPTDSQHVTTSYFSRYICQLCRRSTNWKWIRIFQDRWR